jgi:hypothetical protein
MLCMAEAIFAVLGVSVAAFAIWLTVRRLVNHRKPQSAALLAAAVVVVALALYVVSCPLVYAFGDMGLLSDHARSVADKFYRPIGRILDAIFGGNC